MYSRNPIIEELKEIAPALANASAELPFQAPKGYFEALEPLAVLQETTFLTDSQLPFQAPTGYFETLPQALMSRIKSQEEAATILELPKLVQHPTPVVQMRKARKWMMYAAAAMLTGILVTGAFLFSDKPVDQMKQQYQLQDLGAALEAVPDAVLAQYLEENQTIAVDEVLSTPSQKLPELSDQIQSISNENLNDYLEENSHLESAIAE
ncbi:MAG: hypothetical protein B7Y15_02210 [Bacteroidetes bacterium 24-39-8]|nr:MAG: hypothetical protein B7Y15_02210 [Bacteroidetes bacterium 24-39-8]HQR92491.1 hypothetical protein [Sediminibacterium sp.]HQS54470.1 hypothetical protein [Sediminibacterium sp.]